MAIRKSDDIGNETDSRFNKSKGTTKLARITERFDDTTDNDNPYDDALQYINKKMDEIVDETNTQTVASGSYSTDINNLKGTTLSAITTNAAGVSAVSIASVTHSTPVSGDTLTIVVNVVSKGKTTQKSFVLNAT